MDEPLTRRQKNYIRMRSVKDYAMGLFFVGLGFAFLFPTKIFGGEAIADPVLKYMFITILFIYGAFRFYRGMAKKYYREDD